MLEKEILIDSDEEAEYIKQKTGIDIETITKIQKVQIQYWKEKKLIEE